LTGLEAAVGDLLPEKERLRKLMRFLGRQVETEVENSSVLPFLIYSLAASAAIRSVSDTLNQKSTF
jgi:hypothetical protein